MKKLIVSSTTIAKVPKFSSKFLAPPADANENLLSPGFNFDHTCTNGFVCEHRWRQIYNMVGFKNVVHGTGLNDWWSNGDQQIAFCRGNKGFIVFTNWGDIDQTLQTCLSAGVYCDVISGELLHGVCTGKVVKVREDGWGHIRLMSTAEDGVLALHAKAKITIKSEL